MQGFASKGFTFSVMGEGFTFSVTSNTLQEEMAEREAPTHVSHRMAAAKMPEQHFHRGTLGIAVLSRGNLAALQTVASYSREGRAAYREAQSWPGGWLVWAAALETPNPSCGGAFTAKKPLREMLIFIRIMFTIEWVLKCFLEWKWTGITYQDHNLV